MAAAPLARCGATRASTGRRCRAEVWSAADRRAERWLATRSHCQCRLAPMNAAVFVDFENLFLSLKNRTDGPGVRTRESSLQILEGLLARLREEGNPMVLGRSYAAFDTYPGVEVAHDLALMGLDPQYVPISHSGKNSADIQLALDTARVVFRRSDIPLIVIVSGDRDFIPLARQVLEEGRELVVVAIPDTTSGDLRERVGLERFWNALDLI